ncbi:MAG: molybdenum ABC transporter substrate-binding protein [Candidatus Acinetobacter avistercoris]|uniref:molybdenum ABC transporter substrate-binding protein n=1 Tax=Acinetobacter sp. KS-LM10 TaxID=3120518 RepID=UPI001F8C6F41|nr:molybdenum ABC transporter substrate-binding protein [Candidatus Acinetobacter avistercoris]
MNKLGLLSLVFAGASLTMVGCASTESPETAQSSQQVESVDHSTAQNSTLESSSQNGVAVQSDPMLEQAEPMQATPMGDVPETQQPVQ